MSLPLPLLVVPASRSDHLSIVDLLVQVLVPSKQASSSPAASFQRLKCVFRARLQKVGACAHLALGATAKSGV